MRFVSDERAIHQTLDFCLRVGEVLLASGAGAADVTLTMQSLARALGLPHAEVDVTFISLSMSSQSAPDEQSTVSIRTVKQRDLDYEDLTLIDQLVRYVISGQVELDEARHRLARIVSSGHHTPRWAITLGWGVMCAGIAAQFGGDAVVVGIAFVAAVAIDAVQALLGAWRLPPFYRQIAGGAVATLFAVGAVAVGIPIDPSLVVTANIVMLLAGIGFMGGIQDALSGFYITSGARLLEALLSTAGLTAGVSAGLSVASVVGVDIPRLVPGRIGWDTMTVTVGAIGAAVAAAAFAFASYAPRRILLPIAAIAGLAMVIFMLVDNNGFNRPWAAGIAAFFVGLVSYSVSGRIGVPALVVVVSAVVPMLPELSIYRGLSLLAEGADSASAGLLAMVTAASVAIALASGVLLGEYVAQPLRRNARRLESRLAGPRLIGPRGERSRG
jgi:uncharacterized membrane protein YjjP (DUF1212 family)